MRGTKGNQRYFSVLVLPLLAVLLFLAGPKRAVANGTLTATFVYNVGGTNQPLAGAYAYLHVYPQGAPIMEKYFRPADVINGPTDTNGNLSISVPAGQYRVMLMARAPLTNGVGVSRQYGPPRYGDYVGVDADNVVTITDGATTDLGTVDAQEFTAPITITGFANACAWTENTATGYYYCAPGAALSNYFVFASPSPCQWVVHNKGHYSYICPNNVKYPAVAPTDSNGKYTVYLQNPGTYYLYVSQNPGQTGNRYFRGGNALAPCGPITSSTSAYPGGVVNPITVTAGGSFSMDCTR